MRYIQITVWLLLLISCAAVAVAQDSPYIPEDYVVTFRDEFDGPIVLDTDGEGEKLEWYFDGELEKWMVNRNEAGEPIFTGPLYWMISPEISSNWTGEPQEWNGDPTASTRWPMKAELDYVRIYKRGKSEEGSWDTRTDE